MREKYIQPHHQLMYDPETLEVIEKTTLYNESSKLKRELAFLIKLLFCMRNDVKIARMCDNLQECVYFYKKRKVNEDAVLEKHKMFNKEMDVAKNILLNDHNKQRFLDNISQLEQISLKKKIFSLTVEKNVVTRFVDKYEKARYDQMKMILAKQENALRKKISDLRNKIKEEKQIYNSIRVHLVRAANSMREEVIQLSDKYVWYIDL